MANSARKPIPQTGDLYVYTGEDRDAISVAMNGVGPNGGWVGVSIARMALPDKYKTQEQLNSFARQFAASTAMLAELKRLLEIHGYQSTADVIAKAEGR